MTRSRRTKITLLGSALSVVICCAMLASGTFAWFTSSVASGNNKIVAGNLDIVLEYAPKEASAGGSIAEAAWKPVEKGTNLFTAGALWEPGHTEYVYLRVRNAGSLALKYKLNLAVFGDGDGSAEKSYTSALTGGKFKLSQYLVARKIDNTDLVSDTKKLWLSKAEEETAMGNLNKLSLGEDKVLLGGNADAFTLAVYMPETGVEAATSIPDATPTIYIGLQLYAAQAASEADGFGTDYDKDADYDMPPVSPAEEKMEEAKENLTNAIDEYFSGGGVIEETEEMKSVTANSIKEYKYTTGGRLPSGVTYVTSNIVFGDDLDHITVRHSFKATTTNAKRAGLTVKKDDYYVLEVECTDPKTWGEPQRVTLKNWHIDYSVLSYAYNALNASGTDENAKNLCKALVVYYNAVMALEEG